MRKNLIDMKDIELLEKLDSYIKNNPEIFEGTNNYGDICNHSIDYKYNYVCDIYLMFCGEDAESFSNKFVKRIFDIADAYLWDIVLYMNDFIDFVPETKNALTLIDAKNFLREKREFMCKALVEREVGAAEIYPYLCVMRGFFSHPTE